jgi:hypothetical protein
MVAAVDPDVDQSSLLRGTSLIAQASAPLDYLRPRVSLTLHGFQIARRAASCFSAESAAGVPLPQAGRGCDLGPRGLGPVYSPRSRSEPQLSGEQTPSAGH